MGRKTILVVDNESQRFLRLEVLRDEGYDAMLAKDEQEALIIVEEKNPDPVILDIVKRKMQGIEALLLKDAIFPPTGPA